MGSERREKRVAVFAVTVGLALLFVPLVLVHYFEIGFITNTRIRGDGTEMAVGIAVVLRATLRRLLRTGTSHLVRTSAGAFSRMAARAFTRRLARTVSRIIWGMFARSGVEALTDETNEDSVSDEPSGIAPSGIAPFVFSLVLGLVGIALSFWVIARQQDSESFAAITDTGACSLWEVSVLAAVPLAVYALLAVLVGRIWSVSVSLVTALDGLLLQAYFSGAGSFLPMTTDVEFHGEKQHEWKIATVILVGLYLVHCLLGLWPQAHWAAMLSSFFLIHCFVYSFPIPPLEGHDIWQHNKWIWLAVWIPILVSFVNTLPPSLSKML